MYVYLYGANKKIGDLSERTWRNYSLACPNATLDILLSFVWMATFNTCKQGCQYATDGKNSNAL